MGKPERRQYTAEFKRVAVGLVTTLGYTVTAASRNFGINPNLLYRWKAKYGEAVRHAFREKASKIWKAELRQLCNENHRLRLSGNY